MWKPDGTVRKALQHFNDSAHAHELAFSCRHRWPLLNKDRSRQWVVEALDFARSRYDMELWAYVIMAEHVHALLYPGAMRTTWRGCFNRSTSRSLAGLRITFGGKTRGGWSD